MKKALCTAVLASSLLLGAGDVLAMEHDIREETPQSLAALNGVTAAQDPNAPATVNVLEGFGDEFIERIFIDDKLFKPSEPSQIADAISEHAVEALPEWQLRMKISLPRLMKSFEGNKKIVSVNNVISFIPTKTGIKFVCHKPGEERKAKTIFPRIEQATEDDIADLRGGSAALIAKKYRAEEVMGFLTFMPIFEFVGDDLFKTILNDDITHFSDIAVGHGFNQFEDSFILSVVAGSSNIFKYCVLNRVLERVVDRDMLSRYALASGNMEIIHILDQNGFFKEKKVADLIGAGIAPFVSNFISVGVAQFVSNEIFAWLINTYNTASDDREYTDFLRSLIEEKCLSHAIKFIAIKENKESINFNKLLFPSIKYGYLQFVKYLIEKCHCDANVAALHYASKKGYLETVKYLIEERNCNDNAKDANGKIPLHYASKGGHLEIVKYLIEECHCDANAKDAYGKIPLHYASKGGHLEIVKYLIEERHCDANAKR